MVKLRVPPYWKSSRNASNYHTVTFLWADLRDPLLNPLQNGEGMEQLLASYCSCASGLRTAAGCLHRIGCLMLLCASTCFDSAKVEEPVYLDTARPDRHTPLFCGVPAASPGDDPSLLFRLPPQPHKVFADSRTHTVGDLLQGFGQPLPVQLPPGHDAHLFPPDCAVSNLANLNQQQGQGGQDQERRRQRRREHQQHQQNQPPQLLLNGNNLCYAAASFHLLERVQVDQHLDLTLQRDAAHLHLETTLVVMGGNYRNPAIPRFPPTVLVNAYNGCLANQAEHFGGNECAMEFISSPGLRGGGLLNNIRAAPGFFSTFLLHGQCNSCLRQCQMV